MEVRSRHSDRLLHQCYAERRDLRFAFLRPRKSRAPDCPAIGRIKGIMLGHALGLKAVALWEAGIP
ncbi:hypothetical protein UF75_3292 [Desulfosporosinus sp. I2]|nr:hypothetical protein UF75_3292 [Desulfosporosinus sp. I2]